MVSNGWDRRLWSAITPPTAASGEKPIGVAEHAAIMQKMAASAPAAESEGNAQHHSECAKIPGGSYGSSTAESEGDYGWQSHEIHFDRAEMAALESLGEEYGDTTWPDAIVKCKAERDALSARLAACEGRCQELEAGMSASICNLWSLIAPKAEGGKAGG